MTIQTATLGYARMGERREIKQALEVFWNGTSDSEVLLQTACDIEACGWRTQLVVELANLPARPIWVNPDCGLKTRRWEEVVPSLKNMVVATQKLREEIDATTH